MKRCADLRGGASALPLLLFGRDGLCSGITASGFAGYGSTVSVSIISVSSK